MRELDREDVYEELRNRPQAPEEKVVYYLADVRCIIASFERPPSLFKQIRIEFRNLHPKFRNFFLKVNRWKVSRIWVNSKSNMNEESVVSAASTGEEEESDANRHSSKTGRRKREVQSQKSGTG